MGQSVGCTCCNRESAKVITQTLLGDAPTPRDLAVQKSPQKKILDHNISNTYDRPELKADDTDDKPLIGSGEACDADADLSGGKGETPELSGIAWALAWKPDATGSSGNQDNEEIKQDSYLDEEDAKLLNGKPNWARDDAPKDDFRLTTIPNSMRYDPNSMAPKLEYSPEPSESGTAGYDAMPSPKSDAGRGGCCMGLGKNRGLSSKTRAVVEKLFQTMDSDKNGAVSKEEAIAFFNHSGKFGKLSAQAMMNEITSGQSFDITEFVQFWDQVKQSGYADKHIQQEISQLIEGGAWVDWKDQRRIDRPDDEGMVTKRSSKY